MVNVKILNTNSVQEFGVPTKATSKSIGYDLKADLSKGVNPKFLFDAAMPEKTLIIKPGGRALVPTQIFTEFEGGEFQIRSRSGLALKYGVIVLNCPGCIDPDYRNEWGVILINLGNQEFRVNHGDKIAQGIFVKTEDVNFEVVEELSDSGDRQGGFGSTGRK